MKLWKPMKQESLKSLPENDDVENPRLKQTANSVNKSQEVMLIIRRYEGVIKTQSKKAICYIGKQKQLLKKVQSYWTLFW